jgi:hypothetical protein
MFQPARTWALSYNVRIYLHSEVVFVLGAALTPYAADGATPRRRRSEKPNSREAASPDAARFARGREMNAKLSKIRLFVGAAVTTLAVGALALSTSDASARAWGHAGFARGGFAHAGFARGGWHGAGRRYGGWRGGWHGAGWRYGGWHGGWGYHGWGPGFAAGAIGGIAAGALAAGASAPAYYGPAYAYGPAACSYAPRRIWNGYEWIVQNVEVCN